MRVINGSEKIREPIVSGIFYPEDPTELLSIIDATIESIPRFPSLAIIVPHASFSFSGKISGTAWNSTQGRKIKTVVIIAPRHREPEPFLFLPESTIFSTPLGKINVDIGIIEDLSSCSTVFALNDIPHLEEHGIEVHLPFMKRLFPEAKLVPIIVGSASIPLAQVLSQTIDIVFQDIHDQTLFVVSSNLYSNFNSVKAKNDSRLFLEKVQLKDLAAIMKEAENDPSAPCGSIGISGILGSSLFRNSRVEILATSNSSMAGDQIDEPVKIVCYAAIALTGS